MGPAGPGGIGSVLNGTSNWSNNPVLSTLGIKTAAGVGKWIPVIGDPGKVANTVTGEVLSGVAAQRAAFFQHFGKAGGAVQGALMAGGMMLGMDGLQRGGWTGVGETTAGGAAIGT